MRIAILAACLVSFAFLVHWVVWRIRIPARQTAVILLIFLGTLPVGLAAAEVLPWFRWFRPLGFWQCLHVALFHVAMALAYVVAYSAIEERSPSMTVLTHVADARGQGRAREEIAAILTGAALVEVRITAMLRDRMIEEADGTYRLTAKGRAWAMVLSCWRRLLNFGQGG